jgi:glyoxylase-like metal-dependent hydrolase (beta-lactamase superfamily II)/ferredoxin
MTASFYYHMADAARKLPGNAPGRWFVDASCIDCDQCRQIAPEVFEARGDASVVARQPLDVRRAALAQVTCPTASIGGGTKEEVEAAIAALPERIEGEVYFCGYASKKSYGGSSYLIRRPDGNVLVDSPRFAEPLVRRIEAMGGARWMLLTHVDDVADHAKWRARLGCDRVMGRAEGLRVERLVEDVEPLAPDLLVIPTPGHTAGHVALLHAERYLFTGDHVWGDGRGGLDASRTYCWHSWEEQLRSIDALRRYRFEWVLPGHGPRVRLAEARRALDELLARV